MTNQNKKFSVKVTASAFEKNIINVNVLNYKYEDLKSFFNGVKKKVIEKISGEILRLFAVKIYVMFHALFENLKGDQMMMYVHTGVENLQKSSNLHSWYQTKVVEKLKNKISEFQEGVSNLRLKEIISLKLYIHRHSIVKGGSYLPTPSFIARKNAVLNIRNNDDYCFLHCVNAFANRVSKYLISYPPMDTWNLTNLKFPLKLKDVGKFEARNPFSINVFEIDENKEIYFCHKTSNYKGKDNHINLLLLENKHYVLITDLSRLCNAQVSYKQKAKYFCDQCISFFLSQEKLDLHLENCLKFNQVRFEFPDKDFIKFENTHKQFRLPFVIYADSECILKSTNASLLKGAHTEHEAHSIGFYFLSDHPTLIPSRYEFRRKKNVTQWFALRLKEIAYEVHEFLKYTDESIKISFEEQRSHNDAENCYICNGCFTV